MDSITINSLTRKDKDLLIDTNTYKMEQGLLLSEKDYGICISKIRADYCNVDIGDTVIIEVTTPYGAKNIMDFIVAGIYKNGAGYNNSYGFISKKNAKELYDFDAGYFDIGRIYLKKPEDTYKFAKELDNFLLTGNDVLRAESSADFIHKLAIVEKECSETQYWLELFKETNIGNPEEVDQLLNEATQLLAIFTKSGKTAKRKKGS